MNIDAMLQRKEYDIYHRSDLEEERLQEIARAIAEDKGIDLVKCFDFKACADKFCWDNFVSLIEKLPCEDRGRGIPVLFHLLQDPNWPVYGHAISVLDQFDQAQLEPYRIQYLQRAYAEDDEMWAANIQAYFRRRAQEK